MFRISQDGEDSNLIVREYFKLIIYYLEMNMSNSNGFRSFVSIPKKDLAVNNSNVKESGLFNDFKEIE